MMLGQQNFEHFGNKNCNKLCNWGVKNWSFFVRNAYGLESEFDIWIKPTLFFYS